MGYLILGFFLGVAVSWFWQTQFSGVPAFKQLMQKELAVNGQLGSLNVLKKRMEFMENRLTEIETAAKNKPALSRKASNSMVVGEDNTESEDQIQLENTRLLSPADSLKGVVRPLRPQAVKINREQVLVLWNEGKSITEIASQTRLGKGEIELIISMQGNQLRKEV